MAKQLTSSFPPTLAPRPLTDREYWGRVAVDPRHAGWVGPVMSRAKGLPPKPELPTASDYLAAKRTNDRGRLDAEWQGGRGRLDVLILRRCLLGLGSGEGEDLDDRLLDWLWANLTMPTWVVSAHLPGHELPDLAKPVLDLASCEMAARMADALVMLGPWMEAVSPTLAADVAWEVERRVLVPFAERCAAGEAPTWMDPERDHWNNWVGVCAGSIVMACRSLAITGRPHPEAERFALEALGKYVHRGFTRGGECDEGIGYWYYGLLWAVGAWSRLQPKEFARHVDLDRLRQVAAYPRRAYLYTANGTQRFYAANDCPPTARGSASMAPWLAAVTGESWLADWTWCGPARPDGGVTLGGFDRLSIHLTALAALDDLAPPGVVGKDAAGDVRLPDPPADRFFEDQQAWIVRADPLLAVLAGGTNAESHNHNDLGQFDVYLDKTPILVDLGNARYTTDFFGPNRYRFLAAGSRGHNVPLINGVEQRSGRAAAAVVLVRDARRLSLDLTTAYPPAARLRRWVRTLDLTEGTTLHDELEAVGPPESGEGGEVSLRFWTPIEPVPDGNAAVTIGGVRLAFDPPPVGLAVQTERAGDHNLREYKPDVTIYCVNATYPLADALHVRTRVTADPSSLPTTGTATTRPNP